MLFYVILFYFVFFTQMPMPRNLFNVDGVSVCVALNVTHNKVYKCTWYSNILLCNLSRLSRAVQEHYILWWAKVIERSRGSGSLRILVKPLVTQKGKVGGTLYVVD